MLVRTENWESFGKGLQMVVNSRLFGLLALVLALISVPRAAAEPNEITDADIAAYLNKQVVFQFGKVGQVISHCDKVRNSRKIKVPPREVIRHFMSSGLAASDAVTAVFYVGMRNADLCSREARAELLFRAMELEKFMPTPGQPGESAIKTEKGELTSTEIWRSVLLPISTQGHKVALQYEQRLPAEIKAYMDRHFGTKPFDHMEFSRALRELSQTAPVR
ncbi:MAG: hypothetical protein LBP58_06595 [Azoarcus sp.]|jgi:hypothetical protein|nr:hypothetical protein [Azoarcus sp.]